MGMATVAALNLTSIVQRNCLVRGIDILLAERIISCIGLRILQSPAATIKIGTIGAETLDSELNLTTTAGEDAKRVTF